MISKRYEKYERIVTVSAINWGGVWGDKGANLEKIKAKVRDAALVGANIVSFPELALSGYECGEEAKRYQKPCPMHVKAAETIPGPATEEIARLAKELDVYVIFGMPEADAKDSNTLYISAAVVGPEGLVGKYRKINLAPAPLGTERICFKPGSELPIFETKYGPIGVQICADFWLVPEFTRILYLKGARIIFNCAASFPSPGKGKAAGVGQPEYLTQQTGCRATESMVYVVTSNYVGKERTASYYGYSTIAGPLFPRLNKIFAQGGDGEEIVSATLNFEPLHYIQDRVGLGVEPTIDWKLIANEYRKLAGIS